MVSVDPQNLVHPNCMKGDIPFDNQLYSLVVSIGQK